MVPKFAFLDTTTFIHYPPLEQLNWTELLDTDHAILVVTPVVIRQLNKLKDSSGSRKSKSRAASALKVLESYFRASSSADVRNGVEVRFVAADPTIDFSAHRLVREVDDDWLIASALEFRQDHEAAQIALITEDLGLTLKAKTHEVVAVKIPASLRLPEQADPNEARVRELEKENQSLKLALPDLSLTFADGQRFSKARLNRAPMRSDETIERQLEGLRGRFPKIVKPTGYAAVDLMRGIEPGEIDDYNSRLDQYYKEYSDYLRGEDEFADRQDRSLKLEIVLVNDGGAPAKDIDIFMHFPDGLVVASESELGVAPKEPISPNPPMTPSERLQATMQQLAGGLHISDALASALAIPNIRTHDIYPSNVSSPRIRKTNSYDVEVNIRNLKHKFVANLDPLVVVFDSWETAKSFGIEYVLVAGNFPNEVERRLDLIVEAVNS